MIKVLVLSAFEHGTTYLAHLRQSHLADAVFRDPVTASPADSVIALSAIPPQAVIGRAVDCKLRRRLYRSALRALLFGRDVVSARAPSLLLAKRVVLGVVARLASTNVAIAAFLVGVVFAYWLKNAASAASLLCRGLGQDTSCERPSTGLMSRYPLASLVTQ
jgi:hypothetical protein